MSILLLWGPLLILLGIATYTDLKWRIIPDELIWVGSIYYLLLRLFYSDHPYVYYLFGFLVGAGVLYTFTVIVPGAFGGGDIKLLAVVGAAIGWQESIIFLMILLGTAGLFAIGKILISGNRNTQVPLAPFFLISYILLYVSQK
ncbi:prepilin peptidase [Paenibacillus silvae]|uniref:prepilin peptidase n=1 Tax=Paenibacillus silvae TaxID=1325358 RepID=UPI0025A13FCB|nr:prepilin peptidase [Paenibacillus silvae]MDM5277132.1 prepilin peptidase [Paenibacillus silvae]